MSFISNILLKYSFLILILFTCNFIFAGDWQKIQNCSLIDNFSNDGDSFLVKNKDKTINVRLYFIDCPESSASTKTDASRLREQTRYFGLENSTITTEYGQKATLMTKKLLTKPFTLYTAFARAMGRSSNPRVYGFIVTADGKELDAFLVQQGLARVRGIGRKLPNGTSRDEYIEILKDLEAAAMLKRAGVWGKSNPDRIAALRAEQRKEDSELKAIQTNNKYPLSYSGVKIDLNNASKEEIMKIKGIGSVIANRIIVGRPYKTVDDLNKIKGIGEKTFLRVQQYFTINSKK